jgi:cephalosporin hydroxylase
MTPRKLNVLFAFFSYNGTSTGTSEVSDLRRWFCQLLHKLKTDPSFTSRIEDIHETTIADTPITMSRNRAVQNARALNCDVLVMVDSDMAPDVRLNKDSSAEPFFDVAFNAIYDHYDRGPITVAAPYGGAPPHENMFVFRWDGLCNWGEETGARLEQYTRPEAVQMAGLHEAGALPTGLIAFDIRVFDHVEPPYFEYEWEDEFHAYKASTEDVCSTRDISIAIQKQLGYNPLFCAWSSWAGHLKTVCVDKPNLYGVEQITDKLARAVERGNVSAEREGDLGATRNRLAELRIDPANVVKAKPSGNGNGQQPNDHKTPQAHLDALTALTQQRRQLFDQDPEVIEVGSWTGDSAIAFAKGGAEVINCVDHWQGCESDWTSELAKGRDIAAEFGNKTDQYRDEADPSVMFVRYDGESTEIAALDSWRRRPVDIIFIDADHSYESTRADILAWLPHLKPDGIMIGHDFQVAQFPGVTKAVEEIFTHQNKKFFYPYAMDARGGFWKVDFDLYAITPQDVLSWHSPAPTHPS